MNRRQAITATAIAPLAMINPAEAGQGVDPAVTAFHSWQTKEREAEQAEHRYDDCPDIGVKVPAYRTNPIALTEDGIDNIIESSILRHAFDAANWIDPNPKRLEGMAYAKANPYTAPDADALKAQLRENIARDTETYAACQVEEKRVAANNAYRDLMNTPAQSLAGLAAKIRGELLSCGGIELADGTVKFDSHSPTETAMHCILIDAERLASEGGA